MARWYETATDKDVVTALCEIEDGLSQWEVDRADEWYRRVVKEGRPLTERQRAKAEEILREKG